MQEEKAAVLKEDAIDDMMLTDHHDYKALIPARDGLARAQATRPLSRIDSLERQLSRNVRDYGKWVDTQIENHHQQIAQHESVNKQLAAQISELKAAVVSKEAALVVALSDLKKAQDDLRFKNSTSSLNAPEGTNAQLHDQLQTAARPRDGMIAAGRDPRLNRGTCCTLSKSPATNKAVGNHSRGRPNTPRSAPRGRVEKR